MNLNKRNLFNIILLVLNLTLFLGCSKKNDPTGDVSQVNTSIHGAVEKGPFVRGSIVTVFELNASLVPTGRSFKSEIEDDKGTFRFDNIDLASSYVQITVNGYYFNEVNGQLSASQINLNAIAELNDNSRINVNVLSHLEEKRVRFLMKKQQKSFSAAKLQAMTEIYSVFSVTPKAAANSESISLTASDQNSNILLGISAALLNIADSDNAKLTELLNQVSSDLEEDGKVEAALSTVISQGIETLNPERVSLNMQERYKTLNTTVKDFALRTVFSIEMKKGTDAITDTNPFSSETGLLQGLNALISKTTSTSEQYFFLEGLYSNTISGFKQHEFFVHNVRADNRDIQDLYKSLYGNLVFSNIIVRDAEQSNNPKIKIFADRVFPYFAHQYWILMNMWGKALYIDSKSLSDLSYNPTEMHKNELSTLLITGLNKSISNLSDYGKDADVSRVVAARIAIDNQDFGGALRFLNQLIDGKRFRLANKSKVHTTADEQILGFNYNELESLKPSNFGVYGKGTYRNLFRYTEVILLASESNLMLNNKVESLKLLNQVRVRNGKTIIALDDNSNVLSYIHEEFRDEFTNEGIYFAFLKRHDLAETTLGIKAFQKVLPIPRDQLSFSPNLLQNPGY